MKKLNLSILTIIWLVALVAGGLWYHYVNHWDTWKLLLVASELGLTVALSLLIMRKDIKDILSFDRITRTYDLKEKTETVNHIETFIINFFNYIILFLSAASAVLITFVVWDILEPSKIVIKYPLVVKTALSIIIALGCTLITGKATLGCALGCAKELQSNLGDANRIQRYEYMRQHENHDD